MIFFLSSFSPSTVVNSVDLEELLSVLSRPQEQCCWNLGGGRGMGDKGAWGAREAFPLPRLK